MAPLGGAVALAQGHHMPGAVAQQLHLDVAAALDQPLEVDRAIAEGLLRLPRGGRDRCRELGGSIDHARMPRPPPPAAALMSSGKPISRQQPRSRRPRRLSSIGSGSNMPGTMGTPAAVAEARASSLSPSDGQRPGRGPHEGQSGGLDGRAEGGLLGEEAIARMDGLGAGRQRGLHDSVAAQVRLGRGAGPSRTARSARRT